LSDALKNPQQFLDGALRGIQHALDQRMIDGIKYERVADQSYEMMLFESHELEGYLSRMIEVRSSITERIMYDSGVEREFALALDARPDIKLFVKLPAWFKVQTPIGTYNSDWAIVTQREGGTEKLYLVRETKACRRRSSSATARRFSAAENTSRSLVTTLIQPP
jgi:type III restriction enzyme